jgi:large subunit ribosomal protein L3
MGFEEAKENRMNRPTAGHFANTEVSPKKHLREVRIAPDEVSNYSPGQELRVEDQFKSGDIVDVVGTSKGRGTAGVMKRWGFAGAKTSHGVHEKKRHGGAAGMGAYPGRTPRGFKMPGRMGAVRVTVKNLAVVDVIPEKNVLLVRGAVPGHRRGLLLVREAKTPKRKGAN